MANESDHCELAGKFDYVQTLLPRKISKRIKKKFHQDIANIWNGYRSCFMLDYLILTPELVEEIAKILELQTFFLNGNLFFYVPNRFFEFLNIFSWKQISFVDVSDTLEKPEIVQPPPKLTTSFEEFVTHLFLFD